MEAFYFLKKSLFLQAFTKLVPTMWIWSSWNYPIKNLVQARNSFPSTFHVTQKLHLWPLLKCLLMLENKRKFRTYFFLCIYQLSCECKHYNWGHGYSFIFMAIPLNISDEFNWWYDLELSLLFNWNDKCFDMLFFVFWLTHYLALDNLECQIRDEKSLDWVKLLDFYKIQITRFF